MSDYEIDYRTTVCLLPDSIVVGSLEATCITRCKECGELYPNSWGYPNGAMKHASWHADDCPVCLYKKATEGRNERIRDRDKAALGGDTEASP